MFFIFILVSMTIQANEIVAVVDSGIEITQINSKNLYYINNSFGWDYSKNKHSEGVDYSYELSKEFHGTKIAKIISKNTGGTLWCCYTRMW